jgi:hypothetical protein
MDALSSGIAISASAAAKSPPFSLMLSMLSHV